MLLDRFLCDHDVSRHFGHFVELKDHVRFSATVSSVLSVLKSGAQVV